MSRRSSGDAMTAVPAATPAPSAPLHPAPHRDRVSGWSTLAGLTLGPLAWLVQLTLNVALASAACYPNDAPLPLPAWSGLAPVLWLAEILALALCALGGWLAWRNWRASSGERPGTGHVLLGSGDGRTRFLAMAGMLTSALFLLAVGFAVISTAAAPGCGG
jgi:hypothetical protein